jgi:hypothetical protein
MSQISVPPPLWPLDSEFQSLWRLLREELEAEISARDSGNPPDHVRELMQKFAEGKLDSKTRDQLVEEMSERPDWITHLAAEIKSRRSTGELPE